MPTVNDSTIGSGLDYASLSAWESDTDNNLVSSDTVERGLLEDDQDLSSTLSFTGETSDATRYRELTYNTGRRADFAAGTGVQVTCNSGQFETRADYFRVTGIWIVGNRSSTSVEVHSAGSNQRYTGVVFECTNSGAFGNNASNTTLRNCLFVNQSGGSSTSPLYSVGTGTVMHNLTVIVRNSSTYGIDWGGNPDSNSDIRNVVVVGAATADFESATYNGTVDNNASSDSSAPGTTTYTSLTDTAIFEDPANDDFTPKSTGDLVDNGADLSGTFSDDITGATRGASFDIGAYEYVSAGTALTQPSKKSNELDALNGTLNAETSRTQGTKAQNELDALNGTLARGYSQSTKAQNELAALSGTVGRNYTQPLQAQTQHTAYSGTLSVEKARSQPTKAQNELTALSGTVVTGSGTPTNLTQPTKASISNTAYTGYRIAETFKGMSWGAWYRPDLLADLSLVHVDATWEIYDGIWIQGDVAYQLGVSVNRTTGDYEFTIVPNYGHTGSTTAAPARLEVQTWVTWDNGTGTTPLTIVDLAWGTVQSGQSVPPTIIQWNKNTGTYSIFEGYQYAFTQNYLWFKDPNVGGASAKGRFAFYLDPSREDMDDSIWLRGNVYGGSWLNTDGTRVRGDILGFHGGDTASWPVVGHGNASWITQTNRPTTTGNNDWSQYANGQHADSGFGPFLLAYLNGDFKNRTFWQLELKHIAARFLTQFPEVGASYTGYSYWNYYDDARRQMGRMLLLGSVLWRCMEEATTYRSLDTELTTLRDAVGTRVINIFNEACWAYWKPYALPGEDPPVYGTYRQGYGIRSGTYVFHPETGARLNGFQPYQGGLLWHGLYHFWDALRDYGLEGSAEFTRARAMMDFVAVGYGSEPGLYDYCYQWQNSHPRTPPSPLPPTGSSAGICPTGVKTGCWPTPRNFTVSGNGWAFEYHPPDFDDENTLYFSESSTSVTGQSIAVFEFIRAYGLKSGSKIDQIISDYTGQLYYWHLNEGRAFSQSGYPKILHESRNGELTSGPDPVELTQPTKAQIYNKAAEYQGTINAAKSLSSSDVDPKLISYQAYSGSLGGLLELYQWDKKTIQHTPINGSLKVEKTLSQQADWARNQLAKFNGDLLRALSLEQPAKKDIAQTPYTGTLGKRKSLHQDLKKSIAYTDLDGVVTHDTSRHLSQPDVYQTILNHSYKGFMDLGAYVELYIEAHIPAGRGFRITKYWRPGQLE